MSSDGEGGAARKEKYMKCMILTCASQQDHDGTAGQTTDLPAWSPRDFAMGAFMEAFNGELVEPGELIETWALAAPLQTRRLGAQKSVPFVTEGPYGETHEVLAGYWIVEGDSFDRATEIARRLVACPGTCRRQRVCRRTADRGLRRRRFRLGREALASSAGGKGS
jgi:hypothetical protein